MIFFCTAKSGFSTFILWSEGTVRRDSTVVDLSGSQGHGQLGISQPEISLPVDLSRSKKTHEELINMILSSR